MKPTSMLLFPFVSVLALGASAQSPLVQVTGQGSERFGAAVVEAGDQNNDGFVDVLVGAPDGNAGFGLVYCVSGQYLATGTGQNILWNGIPGTTSGAGAGFGSSLANVGDLTGDGVVDFAVGAPNLDIGSMGTDAGGVYLLNGSTHIAFALAFNITAHQHMGATLAVVGDVTGDGKTEIAVGAPGEFGVVSGAVSVISGAGLANLGFNSASVLTILVAANSGEHGFGTSVASGFDLDGDGQNDVAIGSPFYDAPGAPQAGAIWVMRATTQFGAPAHIFAWYTSNVPNEHLGRSVDAKYDYDGDGIVDIVAGAPDNITGINSQSGRAVVLSGARVAANTSSKELRILWPSTPNQTPSTLHFGAAVRASADLNGDGVGDLLVGAPDYFTQLPNHPATGSVSIFSGASGERLGEITGANQQRLGDALLGAFDDLDGDGFPEFVVAGSLADGGFIDSGVIASCRLFPAHPGVYCTAKVNSLGCTPAMSWTGSSSASSATPFLLTCSNVLNQRTGFLTYAHRAAATPFQGGLLCLQAPILRTPAQNSGGSATGDDCSGTYAFDFNARIQSGVDASLVAGAEVFTQYRARDPQSTGSSSLSNALRFVINP